MKPTVLATVFVALLAGSTQALAADGRGGHNGGGGHGGGHNGGGHGGGYHGGGHGGGYNNGHGGYKGGYNYGHRGGYYYAPYRAARYYGYSNYYGYYGYGHHHNNDNYNNGAAYALGGLVVGSLLTNAYYNNRATQPVYVQQTYQAPAQVVVVPQGRRLLKDLSGNCYERTTDAAGNELRTELPASECNW